jgi:hypothetical protein
MSFKHWFLFFSVYAFAQIIMWVGEASVDFLSAEDVNQSVGFQVDLESSGSGFIGLLRNIISFFTFMLPRLLFFNFTFLQGDLQLIQWLCILIFGGTLVAMTVGQRVLGGR